MVELTYIVIVREILFFLKIIEEKEQNSNFSTKNNKKIAQAKNRKQIVLLKFTCS